MALIFIQGYIMKLTLLLLVALFNVHAFALNFSAKGKVASFDYTPKAYAHKHAINYYIPSDYSAKKSYKVMMLLHGGGASTSTYASSKRVSLMYLNDFTTYAEKSDVIIVAPASSLGWGYYLKPLAKETIELMKKELNINTNKIILFGHSMGGMGITREGHWLADTFSAIFPTAAGMQDNYQVEKYLNTYFNVPFVHINGERDHFDVFRTRSLSVERKVKNLEQVQNMKSKYDLIFHKGGHNYVLSQVTRKLDELFKLDKDLYQKKLFPLMMNLKVRNSKWGPDTDSKHGSYFWLEVVDFIESEKSVQTFGQASIKNNTVRVMLEPTVKKLRIYLSQKMVNFKRPIDVYVNGKFVNTYNLSASPKKSAMYQKLKKDKNFIFDNDITIEL
jgi:hypothetical protein